MKLGSITVLLSVSFLSLMLILGGCDDKSSAAPQRDLSAKALDADIDQEIKNNDASEARETGQLIMAIYPNSEDAKSAKQKLAQMDQVLADKKAHERQADEVKLKNLIRGFRQDRDKVNNVVFYTAAGAGREEFGIYIGRPDQGSPYLRFKFQHEGSDLVYFNDLAININGQRMPDYPINVTKLQVAGGLSDTWYYSFDDDVTEAEQALFKQIGAANVVRVRYQGQQGSDDVTLTGREKTDISKTLQLYAVLSQLQRN